MPSEAHPRHVIGATEGGIQQCYALRFAVPAAVILWAFIVGAGLQRLWVFKYTPGEMGYSASRWPGSKLITPHAGQATLVMFVHPRCSCTAASLTELRRIMEQSAGRVSAWVLVLHPKGASGDWERTATTEAASHIPNVTVLTDENGAEAARFGAETSGQVVLYDTAAQLVFQGGITGSRGHVGENSGERSILSFLHTGIATQASHAVFGCGMHDRRRTET